jgi:L-amino acid N-acyltransferase YncA
MKLVDCTQTRHATAILDILNEAIVNSTAIYDYAPRPAASMPAWFATRRAGGFPVLGIEADDGELLGFASYGSFRGWAAYKYTVEHSVYVHAAHRGRGIGGRLLAALIERARAQDLHLLVGGLDAANAASIALHRKLGFTHAGTIAQAGYKFGRWLDLAFYQLRLETPHQPVDGL